MENPDGNKIGWYKKKRYIIPIGLLSLFFLSSDDSLPVSKVVESTQFQSEINLPVSASITENRTIQSSTQTLKNCHPNYSGCLNPNASDYDCAGGSGNGPYYTGAVRVIGYDVFDLDRDGDGWGCE